MTIQFSSQAIAALSATPLQVWQTITLGTYKGVDAYRDVMDAAGIKIRDSANEILARPDFPYARVKTEVELALLSGSELGVETQSSLSALSCALLRSDRSCGCTIAINRLARLFISRWSR